MKKAVWIVIVVAVVVLLGFLLSSGNSSSVASNFSISAISTGDHVKGNKDAKVVLIEYSDFQCPACRSYYPILRQITQEYGDRIALVYRHFPLKTIHLNADFSARASEAANKQGKFWEMHDLLFEKQTEWESVSDILPVFSNYAKLLGLDTVQFEKDFKSNEVKDFVNSQRVSGNTFKVAGTPTFFLNGEKLENPRSIDEFKKLLNEALSKNK